MNTLLSILLMAPQDPKNGGGGYGNLIMIPLILIVFYFFMIRPQQKKAKDQKNFKDSLEKGAKVVTIGGMHGRISEVKDTTFVLEVGNGVKMEVEKTAISLEMTKAAQAEPKA